MKHASIKNLLAIIILLAGTGVYFASVVPASATVEITAEVVSRTSRSGPTGNTGILICKLDSGNTVMVNAPAISKARTGDTVMLRTYERYLFGSKYQFGGKVLNKSNVLSSS